MFGNSHALAYEQEILPYQEYIPYSVSAMADNDNFVNILLVEDNYSDTLLAIQKINATHIPYRLDRITHGDDVLPYLGNCLQTRLPDIMFLDLGLPGVDGFDVLQALAAAPAILRSVPIALVTGLQDFTYLSSHYHNLSIYGCLSKPLCSDDIIPIFAQAMDFRH